MIKDNNRNGIATQNELEQHPLLDLNQHSSTLADHYHASTLVADHYHASTLVADHYHASTLVADQYHASTLVADQYHASTLVADRYHASILEALCRPSTNNNNCDIFCTRRCTTSWLQSSPSALESNSLQLSIDPGW